MTGTPKPARSAWLIAQRKAHGESVEDVARIVDRDADTIRGWEAGRPPKRADDASFVVLERHWGSMAPRTEAPSGGDQTALVAAIENQTKAISELVELLRPMAEAQAQQVADLQAAVQRLLSERGLPTVEGQPVPPVVGE